VANNKCDRPPLQDLPQHQSLFEEHAIANRRLAVAERHVEESRQQISRQKSEVAALQSGGRKNSLTARMARELLRSMENELSAHLAERGRLRQKLRSSARLA
jgi:hypothetical protein